MKTDYWNTLNGEETYRAEVVCKTKYMGMHEKIAPKDYRMFEFRFLHQLISLHFLIKCFQRLVIPCEIENNRALAIRENWKSRQRRG